MTETLHIQIKTAFEIQDVDSEFFEIQIDRHATVSELWERVSELFPNSFQTETGYRMKLYSSSGTRIKTIPAVEDANFLYLVDRAALNSMTRIQLFSGT